MLLISLSCFIFKNKVFAPQNCQLFAFIVIFNALSIFLTLRKYLTQNFEIMTVSKSKKQTMPLVYVDHNYFHTDNLGYFFPTYNHVGNNHDLYLIYKRPKKCLR